MFTKLLSKFSAPLSLGVTQSYVIALYTRLDMHDWTCMLGWAIVQMLVVESLAKVVACVCKKHLVTPVQSVRLYHFTAQWLLQFVYFGPHSSLLSKGCCFCREPS